MSSDVLVSARVTQAKKDASKKILDSLGATTSDLINQAFDYVIETKKLPDPTGDQNDRPDRKDITNFISESSLSINWNDNLNNDLNSHNDNDSHNNCDNLNGDYRSIIRKRKQEQYESLA